MTSFRPFFADVEYVSPFMEQPAAPSASWLDAGNDALLVLTVKGRSFLVDVSGEMPTVLSGVGLGANGDARAFFQGVAGMYQSEMPPPPPSQAPLRRIELTIEEAMDVLRQSDPGSPVPSDMAAFASGLISRAGGELSRMKTDGPFAYREYTYEEIAEAGKNDCLRNSESKIGEGKLLDGIRRGDAWSHDALKAKVAKENPGKSEDDIRRLVADRIEKANLRKAEVDAASREAARRGATSEPGIAPPKVDLSFPTDIRPRETDYSRPAPTPGPSTYQRLGEVAKKVADQFYVGQSAPGQGIPPIGLELKWKFDGP